MKLDVETKFNIGDKVRRHANGEVCTVEDIYIDFGKNNIKKIYYHARNEQNNTDLCLSGCQLEKASILDKEEHDYLRAVIKPYKVEYIKKTETLSGKQYIQIVINSSLYFGSIASWIMPYFTKGTMYKGMEIDKDYTIQELELDKEWSE